MENKTICYKCIELENNLNLEKQEVQILSDIIKMEKEKFANELQFKKQLSEACGNVLFEKNENIVLQEKFTDNCVSIQKKNAELLMYISELENNNASYLSQIEKQQSKLESLHTQLKDSIDKSENLNKSVESYKKRMKELSADYEKELNCQKDTIERLTDRLSEQQEKVNRLSEVDAGFSRLSLNNSLAGGCVSCANLIETNKRLSELVESSRHQESEYCAKIQELNNFITSLTEDKNQLKEDKKNLENKCDRYFDAKFSMQEKLKTEQSLIEELRQKLDKQADTILSLQAHKDVEDDQGKKIKTKMEHTINLLKARAKEDRELFDSKVNELNSEIRHHKETVRQLNNQVLELTDMESQSKNSKSKMSKHLHSLEGQVRSLKEECSAHITEATNLRNQKKEILDQLFLCENKCDEFECEKKENEILIDNYKREIFKLEETNKQQAKLIDFLRGDPNPKPKKQTLSSMLKSTPRLPDSRGDPFRSNRAVSHSDLFVKELETPAATDNKTVTFGGGKRFF